MTGTVHTRESHLSLRHGLMVAVLIAAVIFVVRHLPPLSGHVIAGLLVVLAGTTVLGVLLSSLFGRVAEPVVVIAAPGAEEVVGIREEDLVFCADLHAQALSHGFFVSLGPGFMRAYYRTFLESPHAIGLVSSARGHPVGFLVGILRPREHVRWVLRHLGIGLAVRGAAALAVRPRVALAFAQGRLRRYAATWRRHRGEGSGAEPGAQGGSLPAVLSHMAVAPGARGTGVGFKLVRSFEASAASAGAGWAALTTLASGDGAGPFYARLGWTRRGPIAGPGGLAMEEWTRDLDEETA